jgi:hypothetical protein
MVLIYKKFRLGCTIQTVNRLLHGDNSVSFKHTPLQRHKTRQPDVERDVQVQDDRQEI